MLHRLDGGVDARVGGEQDHQRVRVRLLDLLQDGQPVRIGQPIVEQDEIDAFATPLERLGRGLRLQQTIALLLQPRRQRPANELLVVDDQNRGCVHRGQYTRNAEQPTPGRRGPTTTCVRLKSHRGDGGR